MADLEAKRNDYIKIITLQFLMDAIKQQEELFGGKEQLLAQCKSGNSAVTTLFTKALDLLRLDLDFINLNEEKSLDRFDEYARMTFKYYYGTKEVEQFESKDLPFLNWRFVVQSARAQIIQDKQVEKLSFMNFLGYQNRLIEAFVKEKIK